MVQTDRHSGGTSVVSPEKKYTALLILVIAAQIAVLVFFGARKAGFHEDEFYSYFSSNRSAGLYTPDREWVDTQKILDEFRVLPGERFRFGTVKLVQSWDVHPPLWYYLLHFACSLSAGIFSKWQGLIVNIIGFAVSQILLARLSMRVIKGSADRARLGALFVVACWGFCPAAVSSVMFIRMYVWLTVFVLAMLLLHVRFLELLRDTAGDTQEASTGTAAGKLPRRKYPSLFLLMTAVSFLGFLTQYYYLIALFFAGVFTAAVLLRYLVAAGKENGAKAHRAGILRIAAAYVCSQAMAGILGVLYYPAALSHIFRGYRGKEAQAEFLNAGNTFGRLRAFFGLVDRYTFGGWMILFFLAAIFAAAAAMVLKKAAARQEVLLLTVVCAGYFLAVAKTGLILGETSIRYEIPICPVLILLVFTGLSAYSDVSAGRPALKDAPGLRAVKYLPAAAAILLLILNLAGLARGRVLFLYSENRERITFAGEHRDLPAVVVFNPLSPDHVWWIPDLLMQYPEVYFVSADNTGAFPDLIKTESGNGSGEGTDPAAKDAEAVVYAADAEQRDIILRKIAEEISQDVDSPAEITEIGHRDMWTVFLAGGKESFADAEDTAAE